MATDTIKQEKFPKTLEGTAAGSPDGSSQSTQTYKPDKLTVSQLLKYKNLPVRPIDGCQNIPGITIPPHLTYKGGLGIIAQTIEEQIRPLFNVLDVNNMQESIENLKILIQSKVTKKEDAVAIAKEFLDNFLVSDKNMTKFLLLLNHVHNIAIKTSGDESSAPPKPIGSHFVNECKSLFQKLFNCQNIEHMTKYNLENLDEAREYGNSLSKMDNLLLLFCKLYEQRNSLHVKLTASQLIYVISDLINNRVDIYKKMIDLYDVEAEEITDEDLYEKYKKMIKIYDHSFHTLFKDHGKQFNRDQTIVNNISLKNLIDRFIKEIQPVLLESYLISLFKHIEF